MMFTFWGPYNLIIRITFIRVLNSVPYCWGNYQVGVEIMDLARIRNSKHLKP